MPTTPISFEDDTFNQYTSRCMRYCNEKQQHAIKQAKAYMLNSSTFQRLFFSPFTNEENSNIFSQKWETVERNKEEKILTFGETIDKINLKALSETLKECPNLPDCDPETKGWRYDLLQNCWFDDNHILFYMMKVKLNALIFESDSKFNIWKREQKFNSWQVHFPHIIQRIKQYKGFNDTYEQMKEKLDWCYKIARQPYGPRYCWILVVPSSHFYCQHYVRNNKELIPLPYDWLALNENSQKEN